MAWTIEYTGTVLAKLRKLGKPLARKILDYMSERVAAAEDPRSSGKALVGRFGGLWRYRVDDYRVICPIQDSVLCV